jgi:hypothetical protein
MMASAILSDTIPCEHLYIGGLDDDDIDGESEDGGETRTTERFDSTLAFSSILAPA